MNVLITESLLNGGLKFSGGTEKSTCHSHKHSIFFDDFFFFLNWFSFFFVLTLPPPSPLSEFLSSLSFFSFFFSIVRNRIEKEKKTRWSQSRSVWRGCGTENENVNRKKSRREDNFYFLFNKFPCKTWLQNKICMQRKIMTTLRW